MTEQKVRKVLPALDSYNLVCILLMFGAKIKILPMKGSLIMRSIMKSSALAVICFSFLVPAAQATLVNPDFENGLNGWTDLSSSGSVTLHSGTAVLTGGVGEDAFSAVLVQGDDGTFSFTTPVIVSPLASRFEFSLWLLEKVEDLSESGSSIFFDSLSLAFYDSADAAFDLVFSNLNFTQGGVLSLDISALVGRSVAISFELRDEDDGFNLAIGLDNLAIIERVDVPESSSLALFLFGFISLLLARRVVRR